MQRYLSLFIITFCHIAGGSLQRMIIDRVSLNESPPVVAVPHSTTCPLLPSCPDTDDLKNHRQLCFGKPPDGHYYHCGATVGKEILEFFYKKFPCRRGYYGVPERHGEQISMSCKACPADRFNPELRWSPENMDQCSSHYHIAADEHAVVYIQGNTTDPAVSFCNYIEGWASANKATFCREAYQPCNCRFKRDICPLLQLLPNGSCDSWCDGKRSPENNFECVSEEIPKSEVSNLLSQTTVTSTSAPISTKTPERNDDSVNQELRNPSHLTTWTIVGIVACSIIIIILIIGLTLVLLYLVFKKRKKVEIQNTSRTKAGGNLIMLTGKHNTVNYNYEQPSNEKSLLMEKESNTEPYACSDIGL